MGANVILAPPSTSTYPPFSLTFIAVAPLETIRDPPEWTVALLNNPPGMVGPVPPGTISPASVTMPPLISALVMLPPAETMILPSPYTTGSLIMPPDRTSSEPPELIFASFAYPPD